MAHMGLLRDIDDCVNIRVPQHLPVFVPSQIFDVRVAGVSYEEYGVSAKLVTRVTVDSIRRFDYDWAFMSIDGCLEPEAFGVGAGPRVGGKGIFPWTPCEPFLPPDSKTLASLRMPDPHEDGRMPLALEAISAVRAEFGDTVCVTARVSGAFSLMTHLYGTTQAMLLLYDDPDLVRHTIDFLLQHQIAFAGAQLEAGAHAILLSDLNSSSELISVAHHREFAYDANEKLIRSIQDQNGLVFLHCQETDINRLKMLVDLRPDALTVAAKSDIVEVRHELGRDICLIGGLDPITVFLQSDPQGIHHEVKRIIDAVSIHGGHILMPEASISYETPIENVLAYVESAHQHWASARGMQPE